MWTTTVLLRACAQDFWKGKIQLCGKYKLSMSTSRGYPIQKKILLAGHWFTLDPNIASMQLPLHFGDVVVSSNGIFWKSFSVLLFMLTSWIIKLNTLKSALLWTWWLTRWPPEVLFNFEFSLNLRFRDYLLLVMLILQRPVPNQTLVMHPLL